MLKENLRSQLRASYNESELKRWFDPLTLAPSDSGGIAVLFPHPLFSGWFDGEKRAHLEQALKIVEGPDISVRFHSPAFGTSGKFPEGRRLPPAPRLRKPHTGNAGWMDNSFSSLDPAECSFDSFIFNKKNEFPVTLAKDMCRTAGRDMHIPFVICGRGVCGKTHLLRAMSLVVNDSLAPDAQGNIFLGNTGSLVSLLDTHGSSVFHKTLLGYQAVFLDDMQEISRHAALQNELAHVLDSCKEQKKPLVLVVEDLSQQTISAKLRSRIEGGMIITLKKPDMDVRLSCVKRLAHSLRLSLSKEQLLGLAQQYHDFRLLQGVIGKLAAFVDRRDPDAGRSLDDIEFASVLDHNAATAFRPMNPETIMNIVGERFGMVAKDIAGNGRSQDMVLARQISMFLCRDILGLSFPAIGALFGGKNHATVVYSCKKVQELRDSNNNMNKLVSNLKKKCLTIAV